MIDYSVLESGMIGVVGIPFDANSSFLTGPAKAPLAIRNAFGSSSSNRCSEDGRDLDTIDGWVDLGNFGGESGGVTFEIIEDGIQEIVSTGARVVSLGGDHSITYPIIKGIAAHHTGVTILQLDAHPDLYDELDGNQHSHACPFARIMEDGLVDRLIQVGIRTMNPHQQSQAERFGVEVISAADFARGVRPVIDGPLYLTLDMDVFDPAFAPGVSHHEPGGLSSREVLQFLQSIDATLVGADIVELNPERDSAGITAMLSAKLLKEILALMLSGSIDV